MGLKKKKKPKLLSSTRPPTIHSQPPASLSSRASRTVIRTHHTLQKQLNQAIASNDTKLAASLRSQIDSLGGLKKYQRASILGQSSERGGDSSKVLIEWVTSALQESTGILGHVPLSKRYKLLEVGALSPSNACSRSKLFEVERIDLHSQHPHIVEQDFMERLIPDMEEELERDGFDIVSLSLVVNYVPDAASRGEMLRRVGKFLKRGEIMGESAGGGKESGAGEKAGKGLFPALFLVLPAPCVENSRYMDEGRLERIMRSLGFVSVKRKMSSKLVYYLWRFEGPTEKGKGMAFGKEEVRKGKERNNFAIVLR
ncbi:MAG: hypothetical protein MMC33_001141 [Icmadophila ericetorum]|nr:hypothetical protein [Icmadophila ericetorum]